MKVMDTKGRTLKRFAAMSRAKKARGEWSYLYFWAANQKEAEAYYDNLNFYKGKNMDYKLERIREKK